MEQLFEDSKKYIVPGDLRKNTQIWSKTNGSKFTIFFPSGSHWTGLKAAQNPVGGIDMDRKHNRTSKK